MKRILCGLLLCLAGAPAFAETQENSSLFSDFSKEYEKYTAPILGIKSFSLEWTTTTLAKRGEKFEKTALSVKKAFYEVGKLRFEEEQFDPTGKSIKKTVSTVDDTEARVLDVGTSRMNINSNRKLMMAPEIPVFGDGMVYSIWYSSVDWGIPLMPTTINSGRLEAIYTGVTKLDESGKYKFQNKTNAKRTSVLTLGQISPQLSVAINIGKQGKAYPLSGYKIVERKTVDSDGGKISIPVKCLSEFWSYSTLDPDTMTDDSIEALAKSGPKVNMIDEVTKFTSPIPTDDRDDDMFTIGAVNASLIDDHRLDKKKPSETSGSP